MCTHPHLIFDKKNCRFMEVPCRVCMECRLNYTKEWAVRVCHEASCYDDNCFISLTYDDEHLPKDKSLHKRELQLFLKRLRKHLYPKKIRFFGCGEYGDEDNTHRPHFHVNIFNWWPEDSYLFKYSRGRPLYRSPTLEKLWPFGFSTVGEVTFRSARYVASYIVKQHRGKDKAYYQKHGIEPEFVLMSTGIGRTFLYKNKDQLKGLGYIPFQGFKVKLFRYYEDKLFNEEERKKRNEIKFEHLLNSQKVFEDGLDWDAYRAFSASHERLTGRSIKKRDWIEYKRLEAQREREKRLNEKIERKKK